MKESSVRLQGVRAYNPNASYEFTRDLPYTKDHIWGEGHPEADDAKANAEIHRVFGHDVATYPNIDNPQHYANVQFAGTVNANVVLADKEAKRTSANIALRANVHNAKGEFARDQAYDRETLWNADIAKTDVQRTVRGNREDLSGIVSRTGAYGVSSVEFEHQAGHLKDQIFGEVKKPEPKVQPEEPQPECPPETPDCAPGTLGNALEKADAAEGRVEKIIAPVGETEEFSDEHEDGLDQDL